MVLSIVEVGRRWGLGGGGGGGSGGVGWTCEAVTGVGWTCEAVSGVGWTSEAVTGVCVSLPRSDHTQPSTRR